MRKCTNIFTIYEEVVSHIWLCTRSLWISNIFVIFEENFIFFFICALQKSIGFLRQKNSMRVILFLLIQDPLDLQIPIHCSKFPRAPLDSHDFHSSSRSLQVPKDWRESHKIPAYFPTFLHTVYGFLHFEFSIIPKDRKLFSANYSLLFVAHFPHGVCTY